MTATWEIETQVIPPFFNINRGYFLEGLLLESRKFFCDNFNEAFETFFEIGKISEKIVYDQSEFYISIHNVKGYSDKLMYIELPEPRHCDFTYNMYVKCYFIPYRLKGGNIEIFDMFGIDAVRGADAGLIVWYKDGQHMISNLKLPVSVNARNDLIGFMSKYIFERI